MKKIILFIVCLLSASLLQSMSKDDLIKQMFKTVENNNLNGLKKVINQAKENGYDVKELVNTKNPFSYSKLIWSGFEGGYEIDYGLYSENYVRQSVLQIAVIKNNYEIAQYLIQNGADVNLKDDKNEETPLFNVESIEMAKILFDNGADLNIQNENGESLIYSFADRYNRAKKSLEYYNSAKKDIPKDVKDKIQLYRNLIIYLIEKGANPSYGKYDAWHLLVKDIEIMNSLFGGKLLDID